MANPSDQEFLRHDREYVRLRDAYRRAEQAYRIAIEQRTRSRTHLANKLALARQTVRRPVGAPASYRNPRADAAAPRPAASPASKPMRICMGPILGWVRLVGSSNPVSEPEAEAPFDVDAAHDSISLELYWRTKNEYERCRKELADYLDRPEVREYLNRRGMEHHKQQARNALDRAANLQLLGVEDDEGGFIAEAMREVESSCRNAWELYLSSPSPKSRAATVLLLNAAADAQIIGLEDSPIGKEMMKEIERLLGTGEVERGG